MLRTVEDSQPQIKTEDWVVFQYLCSFVVMMFGLVFFSFGLIKSSPWIVAVGVLYAFVSIVGFVAARARTRLLARVYFYILLLGMFIMALSFFSDLTSLSAWGYKYCADESLDDETCSREK